VQQKLNLELCYQFYLRVEVNLMKDELKFEDLKEAQVWLVLKRNGTLNNRKNCLQLLSILSLKSYM